MSHVAEEWDSERIAANSDDDALTLLVLFSHPSELAKAREFLAGIACTIKHTPIAAVSVERFAAGLPAEYSARERDLLTLLAKGYSYLEAATCLGCKLSTIQTHIKHIYRKMGVHSRAEAVHEALQLGLIMI